MCYQRTHAMLPQLVVLPCYQTQQHQNYLYETFIKRIQMNRALVSSLQSLRLKKNLCKEKLKKRNRYFNSCGLRSALNSCTRNYLRDDFSFLFLFAQVFVQPQALHDGRYFHALSIHIFYEVCIQHRIRVCITGQVLMYCCIQS